MSRRRIAATTRLRVLIRDLCRCRYCGKRLIFETMWVDHVLPVARGGGNWKNLVCACEKCNREKWVYLWEPMPISSVQLIASAAMIVAFDWASVFDWLVEEFWYKL